MAACGPEFPRLWEREERGGERCGTPAGGESPLKQRARSERSEGQGSAVTYGGSSEKHTPPLAPFSFGLPALAPATHGRRAEPAFATPLSRSRLASACKAARGIPVGSQGRSQRRLASARVPIIVVPSLSQSLLREPHPGEVHAGVSQSH